MKNLLILLVTLFSFTATAQTAEEIDMVVLVNQVRTNPKSFVPAVEAYIKTLEAKTNPFGGVNIKGATVTKKTSNASAAFKPLIAEAKALIVFLNTVKPVKALELSLVLYPVASEQAKYLDSIKQLGHTGANGKSFTKRTSMLATLVGENCATGATATDALLMLLIDYGDKPKGHRANIFNTKYTQMSVAKAGNTWVQDFSN